VVQSPPRACGLGLAMVTVPLTLVVALAAWLS